MKPSQHIKNASPADQRRANTSDEVWAFTEQPTTDRITKIDRRIAAHDLFNLFTANIIKAKTDFFR